MTALPRDPEFYLRHGGYVRALARQVVFDAHAAEDVAQETWLAALQRPPRDAGSPRGWLKSLVRGLASKAWLSRDRREQRERAVVDTRTAPPAPDELVERENARRRVADALLELEEPYRSVLWMRYFDELPPREIAARAGVPVETVRTQIKRGLDKLRARLRRDSGAAWSVALVCALDLEPLSYRAAARAAARTLLQGVVAVGVAKKFVAAGAAVALVAGSLWLLDRGDAASPRAAAIAPAPAELGSIAEATEPARQPDDASRNAVAGESPSAENAPRAAQGSTSLLLHVLWHDDKSPAAHVGMQLFQSASEDYYADKLYAETGDDGSVLVDPIEAGEVSVYYDRGGYGFVTIEPGVRNEATLEMMPGFDVRGFVRDEGERAVAGAQIYLYTSMGGTYDGAIVARSGEDGSYLVRGVGPAGMTYVSARAERCAPTKQHMVMSAPGADVTIDLVFEERGGSVEGRVLAPDGSPCAGAAVVVGRIDDYAEITTHDGNSGRNPAPQRAFTDPHGRFRIDGIAEGTHPIRARATKLAPWIGEVAIVAGHTTAFDIALAPGVKLEGSVRDESGAPVARAQVESGSGLASSWRRTAADGTFAFDGLPLGEFEVEIDAGDKGSAKTKLIGASGETLRWDAVIGRGLVLRGRIEVTSGTELTKWWLGIEGGDATQWFVRNESPDAAGRFEVVGCPDLPLRVELHAPGGGRWPAAVAERVRARDGELVLRADPALEPTTHLRGRIVDPDGNPVGGAQIIPALTGFNRCPIELSQAPSGAFDLGPYPSGEWHLLVKAIGFADLRVEPRTLAPRETWNLGDLVLLRGGQVVVRVKSEIDAADRAKDVSLTAANGLTEWLRVEDGVARSRQLEPGRYRLLAGGAEFALAAQDVDVQLDAVTEVELVLERGVEVRVAIQGAGERVDATIARDDGSTLQDTTVPAEGGELAWTGRLVPGRYRFTVRAGERREATLELVVGPESAPLERTLRIP